MTLIYISIREREKPSRREGTEYTDFASNAENAAAIASERDRESSVSIKKPDSGTADIGTDKGEEYEEGADEQTWPYQEDRR